MYFLFFIVAAITTRRFSQFPLQSAFQAQKEKALSLIRTAPNLFP